MVDDDFAEVVKTSVNPFCFDSAKSKIDNFSKITNRVAKVLQAIYLGYTLLSVKYRKNKARYIVNFVSIIFAQYCIHNVISCRDAFLINVVGRS